MIPVRENSKVLVIRPDYWTLKIVAGKNPKQSQKWLSSSKLEPTALSWGELTHLRFMGEPTSMG